LSGWPGVGGTRCALAFSQALWRVAKRDGDLDDDERTGVTDALLDLGRVRHPILANRDRFEGAAAEAAQPLRGLRRG